MDGMLRFILTALSFPRSCGPRHRLRPSKTPAPPAPAREPGLYATINTSMGSIVVKLYEKESPITVKNFTDLARGLKTFTDPKTGQVVKRPFYTRRRSSIA